MNFNLRPDLIKSQIESEAKAADHYNDEVKRTEEEIRYLDAALDRLLKTEELTKRKHNNATLEQNREARKCYALRTFGLTCTWAFLIFVLLFSVAVNKFIFYPTYTFNLSDKVIITLITSTTINFFGFFLLVMKYLFNTNIPDKKSKTDKSKS